MLDHVVSLLEKKQSEAGSKLKFWRAYYITEKKREFYVLGSESGGEAILDQARMVEQRSLQLEVWVDKGDTQGFASKTFMLSEDFKHQLDACLEQALVSSEKTWEPPQPSGEFVFHPKQCFEELAEDFIGASDKIYSRLSEAVEATKEGVFNSSELFCILTHTSLRASNGFKRESQKTRFYAEVCFSSQGGEESQEFLVTQWAVHPDQLDFKKMCKESSEFSTALLSAKPTPQGEYAVMLSADVLNEVFHDLKSHLDARSKYYQKPFIPQGEVLIPGFEGREFGIKINPGRDWALTSRTDDGWGRSQPLLILANKNEVMSSICSYQMSQYLEMSPSTVGGCLEIDAIGESEKDLRSDQPVLEILQFSGLFTSAVDLTFSSEIRLARLWKADGSFVYLKGGSLSGSVKDQFKYIRFSKDLVTHNKYESRGTISYHGPAKALIQQVPVTA